MAGNLTIKLTDEQQKQIRDVTGQSVAELSFNFSSSELSDQALDQVSGGLIGLLFTGISGNTITLSGSLLTGNTRSE